MNQKKNAIWKKSILEGLSFEDITECLYEMTEKGDYLGYESGLSDSEYAEEFRELYNEVNYGAQNLLDALYENSADVRENWDDMTVGMLGEIHSVYGFDAAEIDYFKLTEYTSEYAIEEAKKRLMRLTKDELINTFSKVFKIVLGYIDIKSAFDTIDAVVTELDYRGALLESKNNEINRLYEDLTGIDGENFDKLVKNIPGRMWVE